MRDVPDPHPAAVDEVDHLGRLPEAQLVRRELVRLFHLVGVQRLGQLVAGQLYRAAALLANHPYHRA